MSTLRTIGVILIVLLINSNPVWAVYKWTDENNVTHYSQQPPKGKKSQEIKINNHQTPTAPQQHTPSKEKSAQTQPSQKQTAEAKTRGNTTQTHSAAQNKNCANAKQNLHILSNNKRIRIQDSGTYRTLSEEDRQQQINGMKKQISAICQDIPTQRQD
jgi:hypothetical protein